MLSFTCYVLFHYWSEDRVRERQRLSCSISSTEGLSLYALPQRSCGRGGEILGCLYRLSSIHCIVVRSVYFLYPESAGGEEPV